MTEKQYSPTKTEKKVTEKASVKQKVETPKETKVKKDEKTERKENVEEKKEEKHKKPIVKKPKVKQHSAFVDMKNLHISTKYAAAICKFIKNKTIEKATRDLNEVLMQKKHVPMKGEYAHKKGKGKVASGAGKYPVKATKEFLVMLKSLAGNAVYNEIEKAIITEAVANIGERPFGRFGSVRRKRTHVKIVATEKKMIKKKKSKTKNKMEKKK
ncbi:MAG: uL22 family ribosomal protein [Candidatus Pacearchaeota archaeon]|jgi:ribosomal protein L22